MVTGLVFARFSRPVADILFSQNAVMSWMGDLRSFQFRIINTRNNQIIDLHVRLLVSRFEDNGEGKQRCGAITRSSWSAKAWSSFLSPGRSSTPSIRDSPLFGVTEDSLCESGAEFLILLTGMDETFSQVVNARSSYRANEVIWDAKFTDIFVYDPEGRMAGIDMKRFHDTARISTQP